MLVIPGVLLANRKPANAMHKVQRTRRILILMRVTPDYEQVREIPFHIYRTEGQTSQSGKDGITVPQGTKMQNQAPLEKSFRHPPHPAGERLGAKENAPCRAQRYADTTLTSSPAGGKRGYHRK